MAGRKPIPTPLKLLRNNPGKRPINYDEPKPERGITSCPRHLIPEARKEWRWISRQLDILGLLTRIDRSALAGYCQAYGRWVKAEKEIAKSSELVKAKDSGAIMTNPWLWVSNRAFDQWKSMLGEFGLSPSSRSRLAVKREPEDAEEKYFKAAV